MQCPIPSQKRERKMNAATKHKQSQMQAGNTQLKKPASSLPGHWQRILKSDNKEPIWFVWRSMDLRKIGPNDTVWRTQKNSEQGNLLPTKKSKNLLMAQSNEVESLACTLWGQEVRASTNSHFSHSSKDRSAANCQIWNNSGNVVWGCKPLLMPPYPYIVYLFILSDVALMCAPILVGLPSLDPSGNYFYLISYSSNSPIPFFYSCSHS